MSYLSDQYAGIAADWAARRQQEAYQQSLDAARASTRQAEFWHGETLAVLGAALGEVQRIDPDSILLIPQVQDRIRRIGSDALKRTKQTKGQNFWQPVWDLKFNLPEVLVELRKEHEATRAVVVKKLGAAKVVEKRFFWRPWRKYGRVAGFKFPTGAAAEAAKLLALDLAKVAKLGDELGIERLLKRAQ